jgi:hypothetical protein
VTKNDAAPLLGARMSFNVAGLLPLVDIDSVLRRRAD